MISRLITPHLLFLGLWMTAAAEIRIDDVQRLLRTGEYEKCLKQVESARGEGQTGVEWDLVHVHAQLALGLQKPAMETLGGNLLRHHFSLRAKWLAHEVFIRNGNLEMARAQLDRIYRLGGSFHINFWDPSELVVLGRTLLELGAEPKVVLENFFDKALESDPNCLDAYLASGQLALRKQDYGLARTQFEKGLKRDPEEPDLLLGMAQAHFHGDRRRMQGLLDQVLDINPRFAEAKLLLAEHLLDVDQYAAAAELADAVLEDNPFNPKAWSIFALVAELRHDTETASIFRSRALDQRPKNPEVDSFLGRKLSQKYLFEEGAKYQRKALVADPSHLPSKLQLAQDLLRLGNEDEGWELVLEVNEADAYNVTAFNLANLQEKLAKFAIIENEHFIIRMDEVEANVYGSAVLNLLMEARNVLNSKYGFNTEKRTTVEIYPDQADFAVRTFGMPGGAGYLGVCFGSLVTANSPSSLAVGGRHNWQAILWHEYCHVVTLGLTKNRIPRWLSEGISVYEELQRNGSWGQRMDRRYKQIIERDEMTPVSELSSAFSRAPNPIYMMFAYYQSALVVEFIVESYGFEALLKILLDLGNGESINQSIENHTAHIEEIDARFKLRAKQLANSYAGKMDQAVPEPEVQKDRAKLGDWMNNHPNSLYTLSETVAILFKEEKWGEAIPHLEHWISLNSTQHDENNNAYRLLAHAYRKLNDPEKERQALLELVRFDGSAVDAFRRLLELGFDAEDWAFLEKHARNFLAINPLLADPHQLLGRASEALGKSAQAVQAYKNLLHLGPTDPADVHYRLGRLLKDSDPHASRRHILQALEEAPRFRAAHKLLLDFQDKIDD